MSPEAVSPDRPAIKDYFGEYFERVAQIYVRLKLEPERDGMRSWRQEIDAAAVLSLLNGRHKFLPGGIIFSPRSFYHAGAQENEAWIRVSKGDKGIKYKIEEGSTLPKATLQENNGRSWRDLVELGEIGWPHFETFVAFGERLVGLKTPTRRLIEQVPFRADIPPATGGS